MLDISLSLLRRASLVFTLRKVVSEEGASRAFAGVLPRSAAISMGGFVFFGAYELAGQILARVVGVGS